MISTRRQFMAGTLASAGALLLDRNAISRQKKYSPHIVCNMYYWNMMFRTPFQYIPSRPEFKKNPPEPEPFTTNDGMVWNDGQWNKALSDVKYAGYKRMEVVSATAVGTQVGKISELLDKYDLMIDHIWHSGQLYPAETAEKTIAGTIDLLDKYSVPLKTPNFFFDPFSGQGPQTNKDIQIQNRSLDRIGREVTSRGMKLSIHNHESPMYNNAKEWLGVLHNTDPLLVFMCLDLDWTWQTGLDPLPLMYEAGNSGRLGALHMRTQHNKIMDQCMEDGGDIDYHKVAEYLKKIQFDGTLVEESVWMKETKVTRSARDNKKVSRKWCEKVFNVSANT